MLARRLLRAVGGAFVSHSAGVGRQARDHAAVRPLPFFPRLPRCGGSARQPLSRLFATTGDGLPDPLALTEKRLDAAKAERDAAEKKRDAAEKKRDAAKAEWANHGEPDNGPYYDMLKEYSDMLKDAQAAVQDAQAAVRNAENAVVSAQANVDAAIRSVLTTTNDNGNGTARLPEVLRVVRGVQDGEYVDTNPWKVSLLGTDFANELRNAEAVDAGAGVQVLKMTRCIMDPTATGTKAYLFFREPVRRTMEALYKECVVMHQYKHAGIKGNSGTGKSYHTMFWLRLALREKRTVVVELRKAGAVYLFHFNNEDNKYDAWSVDSNNWNALACAALCSRNSLLIVDPAAKQQQELTRTVGSPVLGTASDVAYLREWAKDGKVWPTGTVSLAEAQVIVGAVTSWTAEEIARRYLVVGGRLRSLLGDNSNINDMVAALSSTSDALLSQMGGIGSLSNDSGAKDGPGALLSAEPVGEPGDITIEPDTRLFAASPFALELMSVGYVLRCHHNMELANNHILAGRFFEDFAKAGLALGGEFRMLELKEPTANDGSDGEGASAPRTVFLPPAGVVLARTGTGMVDAFTTQWKALPAMDLTHTSATVATTDGHVDGSAALFGAMQLLGQTAQPRLARFDTDFAPALKDLSSAAHKSAPKYVFFPAGTHDNMPGVDGALARNVAVQITISAVANKTWPRACTMKTLLDGVGASAADPVWLLVFVTAAEFNRLLETPANARRLGFKRTSGKVKESVLQEEENVRGRTREMAVCVESLSLDKLKGFARMLMARPTPTDSDS